jgi:hypothetical protein
MNETEYKNIINDIKSALENVGTLSKHHKDVTDWINSNLEELIYDDIIFDLDIELDE